MLKHREACFSLRNVDKSAKYGFATRGLSGKDSTRRGNRLTLRKVSGAVVNKEGHADCVPGHESTYHY